MGIIYFIIVLAATTIGSIAGIGGGVLIKPILDALADFNLSTIGVLSSIAVLSMAVVSTARGFIDGIKIDKKLILLAIGAIAGGFAGKEIFDRLLIVIDGSVMQIVQASMIALLMIIILFKNKIPKVCIENVFAVLFVGFILGTLSSFLGIGGGPVNVAVIYLLLNMDIKKAAAGSIFIILLAQASKIGTIALSEGLSSYNLNMLWYMIPAGITGGLIGPYIQKKLNEKTVHYLFDITVIIVILICVYNILTVLI